MCIGHRLLLFHVRNQVGTFREDKQRCQSVVAQVLRKRGSRPIKRTYDVHGLDHDVTYTVGQAEGKRYDAGVQRGARRVVLASRSGVLAPGTAAEWTQISDAILAKGHHVLMDCAYQGFASGDAEADAAEAGVGASAAMAPGMVGSMLPSPPGSIWVMPPAGAGCA